MTAKNITRAFLSSLTVTVLLTVFLHTTPGCASSLIGKRDTLNLYFYSNGTPIHFIVVEKSSQRLLLFSLAKTKTIRLLNRFTCATGENPGSKLTSGDSRTPEGIYYITRFYEDKKITVFGSRAFHLDYPNIFDKNAGHNGDGIYIHGTNRQLLPFSTNGCITLNNDDLDTLAPYLTVDMIPVIIVNTLNIPVADQTVILTKEDKRLTDILKQFSPDIAEIDKDLIETLTFFRNEDRAVASLNYFTFDGDRLRYKNRKKLYLKTGLSRDWLVLHSTQSQYGIPSILAIHPGKTAFNRKSGLKPAESPDDQTAEILSFIHRWRTAWSQKNLSSYIHCYSPSFRSGGLDLEKWRKKKSRLNKKYAYIKVSISNIHIKLKDNSAVVTFHQTYTSDKFKTAGMKTLYLVKNNNRWMIQREFM
jgi:murein L,D-transpeptidase YafK